MSSRRGHGEGSIYKRKDGRWAGTVEMGHEGGRRKRKTVYGATRAEVVKKAKGVKAAQDQGLSPADDRLTVGAYLTWWLSEIEPTVQASTHQRYEQLVRLHAVPVIGSTKLSRLTPDHLQNLYSDRLRAGQSEQSVKHLHRMLHTALKRAVRFNKVQRNVAALLLPEDLPKVQKSEMKTLRSEEVHLVLAAAEGDRFEALWILAFTTGMREGELLGLKWEDIDLTSAKLSIRRSLKRTPDNRLVLGPTKTRGSVGVVPLTSMAVESLRRRRAAQAAERLRLGETWDDQDLVFTNRVGRPINPSNLLLREFYPLLERAGVAHIRFHDIRHTVATLLMEQGVDTKVVSNLLRHADVGITQNLYQHVTPRMQWQAVQALEGVLGGGS